MTDFINAKRLQVLVTNNIDPTVIMQAGSFVWWFSVVLAGCRLGKNVVIGSRTELGFNTIVGDDTRIGSGVFLPPNSIIGARVFIGPNATFTDDRLPRVHVAGEPPYHAEPPVIEDDAVIGAAAVILPGVRIGAGARIAAGAIVTSNVDPGTIVRGLPARMVDIENDHPWLAVKA